MSAFYTRFTHTSQKALIAFWKQHTWLQVKYRENQKIHSFFQKMLQKHLNELSGQLNISGDTDFLLTINYFTSMCGRQGLKKKKSEILGFELASVIWLWFEGLSDPQILNCAHAPRFQRSADFSLFRNLPRFACLPLLLTTYLIVKYHCLPFARSLYILHLKPFSLCHRLCKSQFKAMLLPTFHYKFVYLFW